MSDVSSLIVKERNMSKKRTDKELAEFANRVATYPRKPKAFSREQTERFLKKYEEDFKEPLQDIYDEDEDLLKHLRTDRTTN